MERVIPILTVVDCVAVMAKVTPGSVDNPTYLGDYGSSDAYIYMLTNSNYVVGNEGHSELTIKATVGSLVQWTITSIGEGLNYNVILQKVTPNNLNAITAPSPVYLTVNEYVGAPAPAVPTAIAYPDHVFTAQVTNNNQGQLIQYTVTFSIVDTAGKTLGYFYWDPFIQVVANNS